MRRRTPGDMVVDIGLGFGFDMIDGRVVADQSQIAERQERLVWTERALQAFIESKGMKGNLAEIFGIFLGKIKFVSQIPTPNIPAVIASNNATGPTQDTSAKMEF